jgi:hypothetical protein
VRAVFAPLIDFSQRLNVVSVSRCARQYFDWAEAAASPLLDVNRPPLSPGFVLEMFRRATGERPITKEPDMPRHCTPREACRDRTVTLRPWIAGVIGHEVTLAPKRISKPSLDGGKLSVIGADSRPPKRRG